MSIPVSLIIDLLGPIVKEYGGKLLALAIGAITGNMDGIDDNGKAFLELFKKLIDEAAAKEDKTAAEYLEDALASRNKGRTKTYAAVYGVMTDEEAARLINAWLSSIQDMTPDIEDYKRLLASIATGDTITEETLTE